MLTELVRNLQFLIVSMDFFSCDTSGPSDKVLLKFLDMEDRNICLPSIPSKNSSLLRHLRQVTSQECFHQVRLWAVALFRCIPVSLQRKNPVTLSVGWRPFGLTWPLVFCFGLVPCAWEMGIF